MRPSILFVDDEKGIRNVLTISLMDAGYEVHAAETGTEALKTFLEVRPPIVMADIQMPGMSGIELLREIKKVEPDTEVIMITGHGDLALAIESLKLEATDFITKPISSDALEVALKRANERISMRNALRQYTENLEQLVKDKTKQLVAAERLAAAGETVAGLSHCIKNIASGLEGGAFVLEKGIELDEKRYLQQGWEMLKGNVEKIKNLSLDLLNYAKPAQIEYELCDPNKPAEEVAQLMRGKIEAQGGILETDLASDLESFWFDPMAIHRCLLNLVTNAVDACGEVVDESKEKKIVIQTLNMGDWGVEYQVTDTCCGMSQEVRDKIFASFFSTKGMRGTGIGLMLTKKLIDEHKGEITMESEPGKGTTFIIRLPKSKRP